MIVINTILHPTDFSERSDLAFRLACWMARDYGARLLILHVVEPPVAAGAAGEFMVLPTVDPGPIQENLDHYKARAGKVRVETMLTEGNPASEILRVARENKCDMVLMSTHGRTGLGRLLMGSVAEQVVRKADCPVLTVKAPHPEPQPAAHAEDEAVCADDAACSAR